MDDADRAELEIERELARALAARQARAATPEPAPQTGPRPCIDCGEPIPAARLRALPHALRCIDCAADREAGR
jgi:phage/conjugal plasmid C-4 type zinc finger TraR family protein